MGKVYLDDLTPGMVLAEDLTDEKGRLLLPKGSALEEKHIRIMKIWGLSEADVMGSTHEEAASAAAAALNPVVLQTSTRLADSLFTCCDLSHPAMRELHRLCALRLSRDVAARPGEVEERFCLSEQARPEDEAIERPKLSAQDLVRDHVRLASLPDIYFRIVEVLSDPKSAASHVAEVVSRDPSLTAKLLRLVNSPFYGFPTRIDSITKAITLVGANELTTLALGISVIQYFEGVPPDLMDMRAFWKHSITAGVFAGILAGHMVGLSEERFFVAGLLHDIGRLILLKRLPGETAAAMRLARVRRAPLFKVENDLLGYNHARVTGLLMREWRLPGSMENMTRYHHLPTGADNVLEASILHVADIMTVALEPCSGGSFYVPPLESAAWDALGLSPSVLAEAAAMADRQVMEIVRAFLDTGSGHG